MNLGGKITANKGVPLPSQLTTWSGGKSTEPTLHHISPNFRSLQIAPIGLFSVTKTYCVFGRWRGGATSIALDLRSIGHGFKSYSGLLPLPFTVSLPPGDRRRLIFRSLCLTTVRAIDERVKVKVKASHTRHRALGPELIPVYRQSACR